MVPFAVGGMIIWAVIGLALLAFRGTLTAHGHQEWLRVCLAGFLLGIPGLLLMLRHDANRRRRLARTERGGPDQPWPYGSAGSTSATEPGARLTDTDSTSLSS
jgi:uncharacterized protein DUF2530